MKTKTVYVVDNMRHIGGPKFTSLWKALHYAAHILRGGEGVRIWIEKS